VEDFSDVDADLTIGSCAARSVADEAAGRSEFTPLLHRRKDMACRKRQKLVPPAEEE
jgi:hypothetical protein